MNAALKVVNGWTHPQIDELMVREQEADGTYQASHLHMALRYVSDHSISIDGGAHVGTWSRLMDGIFDRVIAVEPSIDTFAALSENMRTFGCTRVELKHCALGAVKGVAAMAWDQKAAQLKNTGARFVRPGKDVTVERIDDWDLPSLGFLKLDVEGYEPYVLQGARSTIVRCKPVILFESKFLWKRYGLPKDAPQLFLSSLRYRHLTTAGRDEIWGPR